MNPLPCRTICPKGWEFPASIIRNERSVSKGFPCDLHKIYIVLDGILHYGRQIFELPTFYILQAYSFIMARAQFSIKTALLSSFVLLPKVAVAQLPTFTATESSTTSLYVPSITSSTTAGPALATEVLTLMTSTIYTDTNGFTTVSWISSVATFVALAPDNYNPYTSPGAIAAYVFAAIGGVFSIACLIWLGTKFVVCCAEDCMDMKRPETSSFGECLAIL